MYHKIIIEFFAKVRHSERVNHAWLCNFKYASRISKRVFSNATLSSSYIIVANSNESTDFGSERSQSRRYPSEILGRTSMDRKMDPRGENREVKHRDRFGSFGRGARSKYGAGGSPPRPFCKQYPVPRAVSRKLQLRPVDYMETEFVTSVLES